MDVENAEASRTCCLMPMSLRHVGVEPSHAEPAKAPIELAHT